MFCVLIFKWIENTTAHFNDHLILLTLLNIKELSQKIAHIAYYSFTISIMLNWPNQYK